MQISTAAAFASEGYPVWVKRDLIAADLPKACRETSCVTFVIDANGDSVDPEDCQYTGSNPGPLEYVGPDRRVVLKANCSFRPVRCDTSPTGSGWVLTPEECVSTKPEPVPSPEASPSLGGTNESVPPEPPVPSPESSGSPPGAGAQTQEPAPPTGSDESADPSPPASEP
ncbi:hypothetical protein [Isoptericola sp. NPDC019482]|uniref:hypothetical protein n=1 Tax=Isoptericola sp. NPDC019482 TaxID=3154688 RepID=UPI003486717A